MWFFRWVKLFVGKGGSFVWGQTRHHFKDKAFQRQDKAIEISSSVTFISLSKLRLLIAIESSSGLGNICNLTSCRFCSQSSMSREFWIHFPFIQLYEIHFPFFFLGRVDSNLNLSRNNVQYFNLEASEKCCIQIGLLQGHFHVFNIVNRERVVNNERI